MKHLKKIILTLLVFTKVYSVDLNSNVEQVLDTVKKDKVEFIELEFADIVGNLKTLEIPVESLETTIKNGAWFDGSSIKGFAKIMQSDMLLKPDLNTYALLSEEGEHKTARFICNVYTSEDELFSGSPRTILKNVIREAEELGIKFQVGPELEFYFFEKNKKNLPKVPSFDQDAYFGSSSKNITSKIRKEVMQAIKGFGIIPEKSHHEVGEGQHEINFKYGEPLSTADNMMTLKSVIRKIANKYNLTACFMPKPLYRKAGSGMHVNFSICDLENDSLFYDEEDECKLSKMAKQFIAGQLKYIKEMSAVLNPTINSYKRLVVGYESPVYVCWARNNRSTLIRIPRFTQGNQASVRAELRCPDPSSCPYLVFAVMLKAGLEGIKKQMSLCSETKINTYLKTQEELQKEGIDVLPKSLREAVKFFSKSELMQDLFGEKTFNEYLSIKEKEVEDFENFVTDWEISRYLEM